MIGAMLEMLMRQPERADDADNPLRALLHRTVAHRASASSRSRSASASRSCAATALSESTYGTVWPRGERPYETLGVARQHPTLGHINDARVMADGVEVEPGEIGELELRNPAIMLGYYEMPDETAEVSSTGGCAPATSCARNADETFTFVARKKEVIRRRGENLAPSEVEEALVAHPDIVDAAVIAVPADLGEDEVKAFVVVRRRRGARLRRRSARSSSNALAPYKVPRFVEVVDGPPAHAHRPRRQASAPDRPHADRDRPRATPDRRPRHERRRSRRRLDAHRHGFLHAHDDHRGGHDLADELMGKVSLPELAFRIVAGRFPTEREATLFDAVLVSLADHGITPSVLAARLTYLGAPEALQGAVAAGILGGGCVFLGVAEDTARFLQETLAGVGPTPTTRQPCAPRPATGSRGCATEGRRTPGLGHPVHKETDPRVPRMYELAAELDLLGPHLRLLADRRRSSTTSRRGRRLPINGAGVAGAALADLGFDWRIIRGFTLLARTAGILGHLAEEMQQLDGHAAVARDRGPLGPRRSAQRLVAGVHEAVAPRVAGHPHRHAVHHVAEREPGVGVGPAERATHAEVPERARARAQLHEGRRHDEPETPLQVQVEEHDVGAGRALALCVGHLLGGEQVGRRRRRRCTPRTCARPTARPRPRRRRGSRRRGPPAC